MPGVIDDGEYNGYQQLVVVPEASQVFVGSNYLYSAKKINLGIRTKKMPNREDGKYLLYTFLCS